MKDETLAIHAGFKSDPETHAVATPIYQTVAYEFDDAAHGAALFNLEVEGNIYSRIMNPTVGVLEQRSAELEGGVAGLCVSAGSAAINYSVLNIAESGNNVVTVPLLYGGTYTLFRHMLPKLGIDVRFAEDDSVAAMEKLIDDKTTAVFCESIGNPAGNIPDIEALASMAHEKGVPLIVDNTVASPALIKPIKWGADIVVNSMTKYMGGHGNSLGGVIVDSGEFPWADYPEKFHMLTEPEESYHGVVYTEALGPAAYIGRARTVPLRNAGSALSPMNAFLILQGLATLPLRMERHCENARTVATWLAEHPLVDWVSYPGLPDSPYHALAKRYMPRGTGAVFTIGIKGGYEMGIRMVEACELISHLANIGDTRSLIIHPSSTTHRQLDEEQQRKAGAGPEVIRLSIGLETAADIMADLDQALRSAASGTTASAA